jgi:hypothetical protein
MDGEQIETLGPQSEHLGRWHTIHESIARDVIARAFGLVITIARPRVDAPHRRICVR